MDGTIRLLSHEPGQRRERRQFPYTGVEPVLRGLEPLANKISIFLSGLWLDSDMVAL
jgi:hypothetical protein